MSDRKESSYKLKKKFSYSTTYVLWREAVKRDGAGSERAVDLACQHAKAMGVKNEACMVFAS